MRVFVTATGTDVGKTFVGCGLVRARGPGVRVFKPVMTGFAPAQAAGSDAGLLLAAAGQAADLAAVEQVAPFRFAAPLSPDMAAALERRVLDYAALLEFCRAALAAPGDVLIEGIGGVMVPLDGARTVLDWMAALGLPVVLVTGSYLGALSHTLTAEAVLRARGLLVAAVVVSETEGSGVGLAATVATLTRFVAAPVRALARPAAPDRNAAVFAELAGLV